jgi:uncharacterized phiE125 gp8 family phage protein
MAHTLTTAPAEQPVSLAEACTWLRLSVGEDDATVNDLIASCCQRIEKATGKALVTQGWTLTLDAFPAVLALPLGPLTAVGSVRYFDTAGTLRPLTEGTDYRVSTGEEGRIVPVGGWPATQDRPDAVEVVYTVGYGTASDVPPPLKTAIKQLATHHYDLRGVVNVGNIVNELPSNVAEIVRDYRAWSF